MAGVIEAVSWMAEHMEDRSAQGEWPVKPAFHSEPDYITEANQKEAEAWQAYQKVADEELQSGEIKQPDYDRLDRARENWLLAYREMNAAYERWEKEKHNEQ